MSKAFLPTNAALYYGITMNPAVALFFGWVGLNFYTDQSNMLIKGQGCSLLGFAFAAMGRYFVVSVSESGKTDLSSSENSDR